MEKDTNILMNSAENLLKTVHSLLFYFQVVNNGLHIYGVDVLMDRLSELLRSDPFYNEEEWYRNLYVVTYNAAHLGEVLNSQIWAESPNFSKSDAEHFRTLVDKLTSDAELVLKKLKDQSVKVNHLSIPLWISTALAGELEPSLGKFRDRLSLQEDQLKVLESRIAGIPDAIATQLELGMRSIDAPFKSAATKLDTFIDEFRATQVQAEKEINRIKEELAVSYSKTAGTALAGDYGESALSEKEQAESFRTYATVLMVMSILLAVLMYVETLGVDYNWQSSISRLIIILLISIPATYFARESSRHRRQYHSQLRMSLDLHAINPYLASLPVQDQHKLKGEIALRLFGSRDSTEKVFDEVGASDASVLALITKILESKRQ